MVDSERSLPVDQKPVGGPSVTAPSKARWTEQSAAAVNEETSKQQIAGPHLATQAEPAESTAATAGPGLPGLESLAASPASDSIAADEASSRSDSMVQAGAHREPEPQLGDHEPEATWYVRPPSGEQYGPASTGVLRQWIEEGRVASNSLLWRDGWPQWRAAAEALPDWADRMPDGGESSGRSDVLAESDSTARSSDPRKPGKASVDVGAKSLELAGQASIGAEKRVRSVRRVMWIGLLSAVAVMLLGLLVVIASRG